VSTPGPQLPSAGGVLRPVRRAVDRAAFRMRLHQVAEGRARGRALDLGPAPDESASILAAECRRLPVGSPSLKRLIAGLHRSGALHQIVDGLAIRERDIRLRSVRLAGALRLEAAVPWLEPLLASSFAPLRAASARALGRIGGVRAANALVRGLSWRRGSTARLVMELARAVPDLYLEAKLADPEHRRIRPSLALAAGLRRRRTTLPALLDLLEAGTRTERAVSARAIGWIGSPETGAVLVYALSDPEWQVRNAAAKALGWLPAVGESELTLSLLDRQPRVRRSTEDALRRRHRMSSPAVGGVPRWR
jgi:cellulose synthase operon protein C